MENDSVIASIHKRVSSRSLLTKKEVQGFQSWFRKPRKLTALAIFAAMLGRAVLVYIREERLRSDLMNAFDTGHDHVLNTGEMANLLGANGLEFSAEQVKKLFGRMDKEGNGFDEEELTQILDVIAMLPVVSERVQQVAFAHRSMLVDIGLCLVTGLGLAYLVGQSDSLEKKWAASSFKSAVSLRRMQNRCGNLDDELRNHTEERDRLEKEIKALEAASFRDVAEREEREQKIRRLGTRLVDVKEKQEETRKALEQEVAKWQAEAEKCMRQTTLVQSKMERVMKCIKGMDAFTGAGSGHFAMAGAQQGFHHQVQSQRGFSMDTITFGTIENGQLLMFETAQNRKLGEGKDSAYKCTDMTTSKDFALKMYKIHNSNQRHAIHNDLSAYRCQVGAHPRIVSYERVIESESMIFVLMELLAGQDLFDVVSQRVLLEDQARPLFTQLTEAIQHLHKNGVIHCDIKPENAMVMGDVEAGTAHLKLIDFGCSCFQGTEGVEGSVVFDAYMPPEHAENRLCKPCPPTDMWRLGCTLYVMLVRRPPFYNDVSTPGGLRTRKAARFFRGPQVPEYEQLSAEAKDLIERLIHADPERRATTEEVLAHPWVRSEQLAA